MDKAKPTASSGLKADGTPDRRLKENKIKAKPAVAGPTKKKVQQTCVIKPTKRKVRLIVIIKQQHFV